MSFRNKLFGKRQVAKVPPIDLATHEKYPEVLQWMIGDEIRCYRPGNSHTTDTKLKAINKNNTIIVEWCNELFNIQMKEVVVNISLKNRNIRQSISENEYNEFLVLVQQEFKKLQDRD